VRGSRIGLPNRKGLDDDSPSTSSHQDRVLAHVASAERLQSLVSIFDGLFTNATREVCDKGFVVHIPTNIVLGQASPILLPNLQATSPILAELYSNDSRQPAVREEGNVRNF
jgi:hypothetical protein